MLNKTFALFLFVIVSLSVNAQKYKKSTETYDFSFTKDGKMKVVMKSNQTVLGKSLKTLIADKEIILFYDQYASNWTTYSDGKIGDSTVSYEWGTPYRNSICFVKKDGQLIYSESVIVHDDPLMMIDPGTGESIEEYDENGNPMYDYSVTGGLVERINLKDGKSNFKKEGYSLMNLYGDRLLLVKTTAADGALWSNYTLTDWKGTMYFEDKNVKDIYANDSYLSSLVNQSKAEKIIIKNESEYFDSFGFIANGKMGYSSITRGVITEPDKDFQVVGSIKFYYENNLLKAKMPESENILEGKSSIQSMFYAHDYYTEYFVDGKIASQSDAVYGTWMPAYASAETFIKIGNLLVYSKPYIAPPDYSYEYDDSYSYQPTESELGTLIIYDLVKKEIIFNRKGYTFLNYTDKGFLVQQLELEMKEGFYTGNLQQTFNLLDKSGNLLTDPIPREYFSKNSEYLLRLLPDGASEISLEYNYMGSTLIYALNGKVGMFGEYNTVNRAPEMKWRMALPQGDLVIMSDKILTPDDTMEFSGNKPYFNKVILSAYMNFEILGNRKKMIQGMTGEELEITTSLPFNLTDTSYTLTCVEFKNNLAIQNISGEARAYFPYNYSDETGELIYELNADGDTMTYVNIESKSGVYDIENSKWLVPAQYYRLIATDKYYVASYFEFLNKEKMTKSEFKRDISSMKFVVFDLKGNKVISGNAAEVKKKTGVDVTTLESKY